MLALSVAALAVASVQAYALILNPVPTLFPPDVPRNSAAEIPLLAAAAVFLHTFGMLAREIVLAVSPGHPPGFAALGWLGFAEIGVLLAVVLGSIRSKRLRFERLALLYFGCIVLLAAIFKFRDGLVSLTLPFNGPRYFLIPAVVASWVILSAIREPLRFGPDHGHRQVRDGRAGALDRVEQQFAAVNRALHNTVTDGG